MQKNTYLNLLFFVAILFNISCSSTRFVKQPEANISSLHFLGGYEIPYNLNYNNTVVGGLSGIDYDAKHGLYYLISDDRSDKNAARFYTVRIFLKQAGIDSVLFTGVKSLLQPNGMVYPDIKQDRFHTPDPEAIRYNPLSKKLVWTSEGERIVSAKDTVLENPSVLIINPDGKYVDSFALPSNLIMHATENGPRRNGVLEGMCFAENYKTLYVNVEEPLYEDGPRAEITDNNAYIRFIKFNVEAKHSIAQYAYKLSPVAFPSIPDTAFAINGVPDILSLGNNKLLVIERSFSTGRLPCTIKVFIADLNGATDISSMKLLNNREFKPVSKKLLLNMDDLGIYTDNIEGVTFGPLLPNGNKTLIFVADNNFNKAEKAQLLLFEVIE
jgi:hypothetical protein